LLDNAIRASKDFDGGWIRLSSMVIGDYLFIKTENPSEKPPEKPAPGRGYGTRILSDLTARYGGSYLTEYNDGIFTAMVTIQTAG